MQKPNIVLIVIDSLRFDKCHGNEKSSFTPNIDMLIKNGTYFQETISSAASTILAVGSILTGLYPFRNGLGGASYQKLNPNVKTLTKILKDNGYSTYATAPEIANDFGLTCDFQNPDTVYDNYFSLFSGLGDQILNKFKNSNFKQPYFFYIHLFDLHSPVIVPPSFNKSEFGMSQYERMISAIDDWLSKLLEFINLENTIVILTSDHGEYIPVLKTENGLINLESSTSEQNLWKIGNKVPKNLFPLKKKIGKILRSSRKKLKSSKINDENLSTYEKRILFGSRMAEGHRMFDDLLRIPLVMIGPNIPSNNIVKKMIRQVDIFPTILNLVSLPSPDDIDGENVSSLMNGEKTNILFSYIESPPSIENESMKYVGLRTSKFKFIQDIDGKNQSYELYDLEKDPHEEKNIAHEKPEQIEIFKNQLNEIRKKKSHKLDSKFNSSERQKIDDVLKKLGYT